MIANRSIPAVTVVPVIPYPDLGAAIDWLSTAFGFTLRLRIANHRAQMNVGDDGAVVLTHNPAFLPGQPTGQSVMVRVESVDDHHARAIAHEAQIFAPPCDHPYGERQYTVADHAGHIWTFTESIADVDPREWGGTPVEM